IAVQTCRRLLGAHELRQASEQPLESASHRVARAARVHRAAELRVEAPRREELRPGRLRRVLLRERSDEVVLLEAEARRPRAVERSEALSKSIVEASSGTSRSDPLEDEEPHGVV